MLDVPIGSVEFATLAASYGINASSREAASASRQSAMGEAFLLRALD